MRRLTDGERNVLAELEADALAYVGPCELTDDERIQMLAELLADMPPELPVSEDEIDAMFAEFNDSEIPF